MASTFGSLSINCNGKRPGTAKDAIQGFIQKLARLSSASNESSNHKYILFYSRHIETPIMLTPMGRNTIGINKKYWALAVLQETPMDTALVLCEALFSQDQLDIRNQTVGDDAAKIECLPGHLRQAVTDATYWIHEFIKKQKCNHWSYNNERRQELWNNETNRAEFMAGVNQAFLSFLQVVDQGRLFIIDELNKLATKLGPSATDADILNAYDDKLVEDLELLSNDEELKAQDEDQLDLIYATYVGAARQRFGFKLAFPDEQIPSCPSEILARLTLLSYGKELVGFIDVFCESVQFGPEDCRLLHDRRPQWEHICKSPHYNENNSIWENLLDNSARRMALAELCRSFTKRFLIRYNKGNISFNPGLECTSFKGFRKDPQAAVLLLDIIRSAKWYLTTHTFTQVFGRDLFPGRICSNIEVEISEDELGEIFGVFQEKFGQFDLLRIDIRLRQPPPLVHTSPFVSLLAQNIHLTAPANTEETSETPGFSGVALGQVSNNPSVKYQLDGFEDLTLPTSFVSFEGFDFSGFINEDTNEIESRPICTSVDEPGTVNEDDRSLRVRDHQIQQASAHQSQRLTNESVGGQFETNPHPQQTRETVSTQFYYRHDGALTHLKLIDNPEIDFPSKIVEQAMEKIEGLFDPASYDNEIKAAKILFEHLFSPEDKQEGGLDFKYDKPRGGKIGFFKSDRFKSKSNGLIALVAFLRAFRDQGRYLNHTRLHPEDNLVLGESPYTVCLTLPEGLSLKVLKNNLAQPVFAGHRYRLSVINSF